MMRAKFILICLLTLLVMNFSSCFLKKKNEFNLEVHKGGGNHFNDHRGEYPEKGRTPEQMAMRKRKMRKIARNPELASSIKLVPGGNETRETRKYQKAKHYKLMKKGKQAVLPDYNYHIQISKGGPQNQPGIKDTAQVLNQASQKDTTVMVNQPGQNDTSGQKSYFDMPVQKDTTGQKKQIEQPGQNSPNNNQHLNAPPGQGSQDKMNSGDQQNQNIQSGKKSKKKSKKKKVQ